MSSLCDNSFNILFIIDWILHLAIVIFVWPFDSSWQSVVGVFIPTLLCSFASCFVLAQFDKNLDPRTPRARKCCIAAILIIASSFIIVLETALFEVVSRVFIFNQLQFTVILMVVYGLYMHKMKRDLTRISPEEANVPTPLPIPTPLFYRQDTIRDTVVIPISKHEVENSVISEGASPLPNPLTVN